ncbi:hypothetical protein KJ611_00895 [Patescibacteria group bacterium]|nr:hypothetical protein [Patescibacteria group bacterium]
MVEIIPAFLVHSHDEFERKLRQVEDYCDTVQVDILDGTLFPNTTWFDARSVGALRTKVKYELHLMVDNPLPIIQEWQKHVPNLHRVIMHSEMARPIGAIIEHVKTFNHLQAGVAINPETPLAEIRHVLFQTDQLTFLGVHPGWSEQAFMADLVMGKIQQAKKECPELILQIDGGVTDQLIGPLIQAGIDRICAASLIFNSPDPAAKLRELNQLASTIA